MENVQCPVLIKTKCFLCKTTGTRALELQECPYVKYHNTGTYSNYYGGHLQSIQETQGSYGSIIPQHQDA